MTRTPEENFLGVFLFPHYSGLPPLCAVPQAAPIFPIAPQPQAAVRRSDALAPYPPFACKSAQKSRPETGRLAFWRNYLSCTRSRIESVTESCTLCAE